MDSDTFLTGILSHLLLYIIYYLAPRSTMYRIVPWNPYNTMYYIVLKSI